MSQLRHWRRPHHRSWRVLHRLPKFGRKDAGVLAVLITAALLLLAFCPSAAKHSHAHFGDDGRPFDGVIVERDIELLIRGRLFPIHYLVEVREKSGDWRRVSVPFSVYVSARAGGRLVRDTIGGVRYIASPPPAPKAKH